MFRLWTSDVTDVGYRRALIILAVMGLILLAFALVHANGHINIPLPFDHFMELADWNPGGIAQRGLALGYARRDLASSRLLTQDVFEDFHLLGIATGQRSIGYPFGGGSYLVRYIRVSIPYAWAPPLCVSAWCMSILHAKRASPRKRGFEVQSD